MSRLQKILDQLNEQEFVKALREKGEVFLVGGIVRDSFLDKNSKDIDLIVTGIPDAILECILMPFGRVDKVGQSFGVIKFVPYGMLLDEPIDIAIPRVERCIGIGHKDFEVIARHDIPIETDLERRDFTINSIAVNLNGNVIDPFNGIGDIQNNIIRMTNSAAFSEDPLRMLRAVQFSSRFAFTIEQVTLSTIKQYSATIKHISPERLLIELDKIYEKGNIELGIKNLVMTGIYKQIFGVEDDFLYVEFDMIKSRADFYFTLLRSFNGWGIMGESVKSIRFTNILRGDVVTARCIDAIQHGFDNASLFIKPNRKVAFEMFKKSSLSFESGILPLSLMIAIGELKSGKFPKTLGELAITGDDLINMGFKQGKTVGDTLSKMLDAVLQEEVINTKDELIKLIKI